MKPLPIFKSEDEEREFWATHDSAEYVDWSKAKLMRFPESKKTAKSISIRLPQDMIESLKIRANKLDIPYQSYIKTILEKALRAA